MKALIKPIVAIGATTLLLLSWTSAAEPAPSYLQTDELKPEVGHQEGNLGARVEKIVTTNAGVEISLSLPNTVTNDSDGVLEEVVVLGKPLKKDQPRPRLPQLKRHKLINNLEEGRSGLVLYLGKHEDFVLRLNYTDDNDQHLQNLLEP